MSRCFSRLLGVFALASGPAFGAAGGDVSTVSVRTEARVTRDSNVFLQDAAPLLASQTVRRSPVALTATDSTAGLTASIRTPPLADATSRAEAAYTFEWHRFDLARAESHRDHRLTATLDTTAAAWTTTTKLSVFAVDGSREGPVFNEEGGTPSIGGEPIRSRRAQTLTALSASALWQPTALIRVRPLFTGVHQDFHTFHHSIPVGSANYVDRGQALAGLDLGRVLVRDLTFWTSLRAGRQWQSNLLGRLENFSNTLVRPLAGLEGKLSPQLRLTAWAGPSFHHYTSERRAGTDATRTQPFYEAKLSWTPTVADAVTLGGRQQLTLGSGGRSGYRDIRTETMWTHRFSPKIDGGLRGSAAKGNCAGFAATPRNDTIFTAAATLGERLTDALRLEAGLTREWSQTRIPATAGRAYTRWLASAGATWTW